MPKETIAGLVLTMKLIGLFLSAINIIVSERLMKLEKLITEKINGLTTLDSKAKQHSRVTVPFYFWWQTKAVNQLVIPVTLIIWLFLPLALLYGFYILIIESYIIISCTNLFCIGVPLLIFVLFRSGDFSEAIDRIFYGTGNFLIWFGIEALPYLLTSTALIIRATIRLIIKLLSMPYLFIDKEVKRRNVESTLVVFGLLMTAIAEVIQFFLDNYL